MVSRIPVSTVINLSEVFGAGKETARFVTRYLRAQHADLFFADAVILVEGPAERMIVPNFIRLKFEALSKSYITLLEIGGSHAQRDLFSQILLDAHLKAGNWQTARDMLEMRRTWDPDGVPLNRALTEVNLKLGIAA